LTSAIIPSSVTSIGSSAFYGCSGITSVNISSSINSIGMSAFTNTGWYNSQANGIVIKDNWLLSYKGTMPSSTVINIASGIKNIADGAFYNCSNLVSVSIPSSVTSIGNDAFNGCIRLTSIYTYSYNPITLSSDYPPFKGVTNCTLHVPNGSKSLYQAATGWKNFTAIVEFDASAVISPVQESVQLNYHSATRVLYVDGAQTSAQVDVYTLKGERLLQATIYAGTSMSLTTLQKGIYIVKATINQTVLTGKIEI